MLYRDLCGERLSALGLGAMRLPILGGDDSAVDEAAAAGIVAAAMEKGVNYYDTAWGYHGGESERVMGRILERYPRESFFLATKFPGYDPGNLPRAREIFREQLEKCRVDHFDFYLLHNVNEGDLDGYLDPGHGVIRYLLEERERGRIRHLGFSAHGGLPVLRRLLGAWGKELEFGQLQLNWLDWTFQEGREKAELLAEAGLPVWVMEPLRGGRLAALPPEAEARLRALRPEESISAWSFRFLQSFPWVGVTLSGMSSVPQVEENAAVFGEEKPLSPGEREVLVELGAALVRENLLPCTGCRYCLGHCPQGLDIPDLLEIYNNQSVAGRGNIRPAAIRELPPEKRPSACIGCRSCEAVCPQQLKISEAMADFAARVGV